MNAQAGQATVKQGLANRSGDLWGGLAAMLVALPSSIAFGVVVFSALGPEFAGSGALAGIVGAAALGLVTPLIGRTSGLISAPCAPAAAVLSALVASLVAGNGGIVRGPATIVTLLMLTALISAILQVFYGVIGGGKLIKFIPFPVVSGYLSGVGILIALGQLPKLFGIPKETPLLQGLLSMDVWKWQGLVVGLVTMAIMGTALRITHKIPASILGLLGGVLTYFALGFFFSPLLELRGNPLVIGPLQTSGSILSTMSGLMHSLESIDLASIKLILIPALTLSVLLSIDTLKTCVILDTLTRNRHNSNRELIGQGIGNLVSALTGGIPGSGTMGPTLVNVSSGGRTPVSGLIEGGFVILAILSLSRLIAWVPIGALAGIMIVIAIRMIDWSMFRLLRHSAGRMDFAVIAAVIVTAVVADLITAAGVGVASAILLFIRDQIHGTVIHRKRYLNQVSSKTRRLAGERAILKDHGDQGVLCELQGSLFFGTTDQLYSQLEADLRQTRFVLLDMRRVLSVDYTAAHLFDQMQAQLQDRGGRLLFSGMPSAVLAHRDFSRYLSQLGVVHEGGGVMVSETRDGALEWMEDQILESAGIDKKNDEQLLEVKDFDLFSGFDEQSLAILSGCLREVSIPGSSTIFSTGDPGDELFLLRRGSICILLPLEGGKRHYLASVGPGDFFGEISFLDRGLRSADAETKTPADLYVLSRTEFDAHASSQAEVNAQVFARLALAISQRLRQTDAELRAVEER